MEMKKLDQVLLKALFALAAGMAALQMFGLDDLTSGLFYLTFPLTVVLWLRSVRKSLRAEDILAVLSVALAFLCILADCAVSRGRFHFAYLKKVIMFSMTLLFLGAVSRMRPDRETVRFVHLVTQLLTAAFTAMFLLRREQMYCVKGVLSKYLTFGFHNPNLATLFLTMLYMLQLCRMLSERKWRYGAWVAVLLYFVIETGSRNALLTVALLTVLALGVCKRKTVRIGGLTAGFVAWAPMVFGAVYMVLVSSARIQAALAFLSAEGKNLDSRMRVWQRAWNAIAASPLIGAYHAISDGTGLSQMHNSHLDIGASYGLPVLVLVCVLLRRWLRSGRNIYILGFVGALLLGIGEAAVFSGGLGIYIFAGSFLLLAKGEQDEDRICQ